METRRPSLSVPGSQQAFSWVDLVVFLGLLGVFWAVMHFGRGMLVHFDENADNAEISSSLSWIPYYAGRTLLRMWIAFGFSLLFTFSVGYLAAKSLTARAFILPALDILQSVPVLGFLSATVTGFMALFPHSLMGVECASIFAIFTGQVWNMTFGFYHSMVSVPADLQEAASNFGLNRWQRFTTVEAPSSVHSLIWNSMLSFGGGWFFVIQSEAISVMNKNIKLPGLGSYMAAANERGDGLAQLWAIIAMVVVIVASDQLVWRPLIVWAKKFKNEVTESTNAPTSWFFDLLNETYLFIWLNEKVIQPLGDGIRNITHTLSFSTQQTPGEVSPPSRWLGRGLIVLASAGGIWVAYEAVLGIVAGVEEVHAKMSMGEIGHIAWLGVLTMLRVVFMTILATLIWVPIGVWIGFNPQAAKIAQPLIQIAASFPVNLTFPIVVSCFVAMHVTNLNWGSILLIAMGTQWYLLFNVIAGAMAIPNDMKEAAQMNGLTGWSLWRNVILPAIFPFWVTGACTAAGGAWNASIVAEVANFKDITLKAEGLGAYIAQVTASGSTPQIICSIAMMSIFVVIMNKLLWRPLYELAERRFRLD
jgi:NitT/TauT family transport system permease protein